MNKYPAIQLILRHRNLATILASIVPLLLGGFLTWRTASVDALVVGSILTVVAFCAMRVLIDLIAIVVETLMPTI